MKRHLQLLFFIFFSQLLAAQCDASFHAAPISCGNDSVYFVFDGQTSTDSYYWDFGDALSSKNSDTLKNPVHLFSDTGTYLVKLIVKDTGNCADTQIVSVVFYPKIKANFSISQGLCYGDTTYFNNESYPSNYTSKWSFSDVFSGTNNTSNLQNPKHKFTFTGAYQVKLKITDTSNCSDSITQIVQIYNLPKASFSVDNVCENLGSIFQSTSIIDPLDSIVNYYWNTGDSAEYSSNTFLHTYADSGLFTIKFKIETKGGCKDSFTQKIRIYEAPSFSISKDSACRNANIQFTNIPKNYTPNSYIWDFGDSTSSNASSPIHQYKKSGKFKVNLTHVYTGNYKCTSNYDSVFIFIPIVADFTINNDSQCFNGNNVCINFAPNNKISYRRISFDDGFVDDATPLSDTQVCYSYNNIAGGSYFITAELLDSNQCSNNFTFPTPVIIYPQLKVEYTQNTNNGCFKTDVNFVNTSNQKPPEITKFKWDFGDGTIDTIHWDSTPHTYTLDGQFYTKLSATNINGCKDSFEIANGITNINFVVDAKLDSSNGNCRQNNIFFYSQTQITGVNIAWYFSLTDTFYNNFSPVVSFPSQGKFVPRIHLNKAGCDSVIFLDTIVISGPTASIGSFANGFQCEIMDTVTFYNASNFFANKSYDFLWNFGDTAAPQCTTDTKNNINVGMNCNFSKDSLRTKHWYTKGYEKCYYISLRVRDTILGCIDQSNISVALQKPIASPQPNANPPILGLFLEKQQICLGPEAIKTIRVNLGFTQPSCGRQNFWVMWDSTCAAQSGNFNSHWENVSLTHNYEYSGPNKPCSPDGKVTVGLIIQNGNDSTGNICRDTAWYHDVLSFLFMDPAIASSYNPSTYYCPNSTFSFTVKDSIQDSITKVSWDWGDGNIETDVNLNTRTHTYKKSGTYMVRFYIENTRGCFGVDSSIIINVGLNSSLNLSRNKVCIDDTLHIHKTINYFNDSYNYWNDSTRANQGKEHILWDFDDGNGYVDTFITEIKYKNAGNHLIKLIAVDSLGCHDSIQINDTIHVSGIFSSFNIPADTLICAQLVNFQNNTSLYDSAVNYAQINDQIKSYYWTFNPLLNTSSLKNPNIFLRANSYTIQLKTESDFGCTDSSQKNLTIIGPIARYEIISDSLGCQNSNIVFKNTSINSNNYEWQFNDANANTLITDKDTNISFLYANFGKFYPTLIAQGNFVKNGIPFTCSSTFPDSTTAGLREITIFETPKTGFRFVTDCSINTTQFFDTTQLSTGTIISYHWDFGDGDTSSQKNPIHVYADTGKYEVVLVTYSDKYCVDSVVKTIIVAPVPKAHFVASNTCLGQTTNFTDSSKGFNDNIYLWEWTLGDTISVLDQNPSKLFFDDTTYLITLKVTNIAGCSDSISDTIRVHNNPTALFSFYDGCDVDSINFVNTSYSKEMPLTYRWNFGDNIEDTAKNPSKKYGIDGNFSVKLTVTTPFLCADSLVKSIQIYPSPNAKYSVDNNAQCFVGNQFLFADTGNIPSGNYTVKWFFGDGDSSDLQSVSHSYNDTGLYYVQLISTSDFSCIDTITDSVRVFPSPKADFDINSTQQCLVNNAFIFTDKSEITEGTYQIDWRFDNQSPQDAIVNYQFSDTGFFDIKLKISSNFSCADSIVKSIRILPMPIADFTTDDSAQCFDNHQFNFTNTSQISWGNLTDNWNFGDNDSSILLSPSHSYNTVDTFKVTLTSTSQANCRDTFSRNLIVFPMPLAKFSINDSGQCLTGNVFEFTDSSTVSYGTLSYSWDFEDVTFDTAQNPIKTFQNFGNFNIKLIATSNQNCSDSSFDSVYVYPMPQAKIVIDDTTSCLKGNEFNYTDSSSIAYGILHTFWDFGDLKTDTNTITKHTYLNYGNFDIKLVSTSDEKCKDSAFKSIEIYAQPKAGFSIADSVQCLVANHFVFTNQSNIDTGAFNSHWDFGDNDTSTSFSTTHDYQNFGDFKVQLIVSSNQNCLDTLQKNIRVNPNPISKISVNDSLQCFRDNLFQIIDSTSIGEGTFKAYWTLGNGDMDTNKIFDYTYNSFGKYILKLISTSDKNCTDSAENSIQVYAQPKADFGINDSIQCLVANHFIFTDKSSIDEGTYISNWDFGDGDTSTQKSTTHDYQNFGNFKVQLIVTSDKFCTDTLEKNNRVNPNPISKISVNDSLQCFRDNLFQIIDSTSIGEGTFKAYWTLGNGDMDTNKIFDYSYNSFGKYTLKLISTSDKNCTDSAENSIQVYAQPKAGFGINDSIQCLVANHFIFTDKSSIDEGTYISNWDFGDGDTSTQKSTTHDYQNFGNFKVQLIVTSDKFCTDTLEKNNRVNPNPFTKISINDSTQCENQQSFLWIDSSSIDEGTITRKWFLGDGDTSTQKSFIKTYKKQNSYVIKLVETSDKQCTDSAYQNIIVYPQPHTTFTLNDTDQCLNINQFNFNNKSKIDYGTLTHNWDFGDNQSDTNTHPKHIYNTDDTLLVTLISTSNFQCTDTSTQEVIVFPIPETQFTINQKNQCVNTNFYSFDANATKIKYGTLTNYWWDLGNFHINLGNLDTTHVYSYYDSSQIRFIALSNFGCYDTAYDSIIVYPKPKADYIINDPEQCVNEQNFVFTNTSKISYGSLKYYWNFGDGDSSILDSPTKIYAKHDTLFVKLYAESDHQCWDTIQKRIVVFPKPNPAFIVNDSGQCVNAQLFEFTNKSTIDYGVLKYRWTYGDGDSTSNQNPKHVYAYDDTFDVKMVAISNQLCKDSITKQMIVYPKPTPDFVVNDPGQCINTQQFIFTNQSSITSGNMSYKWTFGDGSKDNQTDVTHHYFKNGIFNVKLITTSGFLCVDSITKPIQVFAKPRAIFTVNDSEQCVNDQRFLYTSNSTIVEGKIAKHHWDFQNGFTGNASPIIATYTDPGYYQVVLIEESDSNCYDTISHVTRVFPKPNSLIAYNDSAQCISGNLYLFHSLSKDSSGIKKFDWNIHNLKNSTDSATHYSFKDTGFKDIILKVNSNYNCWDTALRQVYVKHMPDPTFTTLKDHYCDNETPFQLIPVTPGGDFYGQNMVGDIYTPNILFEDTVEYYVTVNGCEDSSKQTTQVFPFPVVDLGPPDTTLCKREYLELDASFWKSTYLWQNGYTSATYRIVNEGKYKVEVTNICGTSSDSIYVIYNNENCHLYIPTAFTPGNDDLNDRYKPIVYDVEFMEYSIYNRWGELLYEGDLNDNGWNGTFNGSPVQMDVYMVVVRYRYFAGKLLISETESSTVTLLK